MTIAEPGHVGLRVDDPELMRSFYTEMMGPSITDQGVEGVVGEVGR